MGNHKETLIIGNIITVDDKKPTAEAVLVRDGVFAFIGDAEKAKELAGEDARVLDYGDNYIYPGFLEAHTHGYLAGDRAIGQADLKRAGFSTDYEKYREIMKEYIEEYPDREIYLAAGWTEDEQKVTKAYLDEICPDKPLIMNTGDGHSMLLNTKALEWAGIDKEYALEHGFDEVHVDEDGEPDGYICEGPCSRSCPSYPRRLRTPRGTCWSGRTWPSGTATLPLPTPVWKLPIRGLRRHITSWSRKAS